MKIHTIVVHCSASPQGRGDNAETIHRWHKERNWSGIGYHYVILEMGQIERGRPEYWTGAHVAGHNSNTIGICLIGDKTFMDEQFAALADLIADIMSRHPECKEVKGHYELYSGKTCPNFDVPAFLKDPTRGAVFYETAISGQRPP